MTCVLSGSCVAPSLDGYALALNLSRKRKRRIFIDDIGEADPHGGSDDTDSPDEQPRL